MATNDFFSSLFFFFLWSKCSSSPFHETHRQSNTMVDGLSIIWFTELENLWNCNLVFITNSIYIFIAFNDDIVLVMDKQHGWIDEWHILAAWSKIQTTEMDVAQFLFIFILFLVKYIITIINNDNNNHHHHERYSTSLFVVVYIFFIHMKSE